MATDSTKTKSTKALNLDAKAVIQLAFEDLGGLPRLVEWANAPGNISQFYTQIWSKIIPKDVKSQITGKDGEDLKVQMVQNLNLKDLSDEEIVLLEKLTKQQNG